MFSPTSRAAAIVGALTLVLGIATTASGAGVVIPTPLVGPPTFTVEKAGGLNDDVFYTTGLSVAAFLPAAIAQVTAPLAPSSLVIAKKDGTVVWKRTATGGASFANFRTQRYQGRTVLTWWEGSGADGHGVGADYIATTSGRVIKKVTLPNGFSPDAHEFRLTSDGRAFLTAYQLKTGDLRSIGGPASGNYFDSYAFVINVATGRVLQRWDAARHIPIGNATYTQPLPPSDLAAPIVYDPFHINSIALDPHGNLVLSFRDLSAVYDINPTTGAINWILGGKHPTLRAGRGVQFGYQHDAEFINSSTLQLFNDNASGPLKADGPSSVERIKINTVTKTATLVSNWTHPQGITAWAMGNAQLLPNGDTFVSWGTAPRFSEFSPTGRLVYDASLPTGSYRAYLFSRS